MRPDEDRLGRRGRADDRQEGAVHHDEKDGPRGPHPAAEQRSRNLEREAVYVRRTLGTRMAATPWDESPDQGRR